MVVHACPCEAHLDTSTRHLGPQRINTCMLFQSVVVITFTKLLLQLLNKHDTMPPLSEEMAKQLEAELRPVFDKFDADGGGSVDVAEMASMIEGLGLVVPAEKIAAIVTAADTDSSGEIEFNEFFEVAKKEAEDPEGGVFASIIRRLQLTGPQVGWNSEKCAVPLRPLISESLARACQRSCQT